MKPIKVLKPKDGAPTGPTCGLCGASVGSSLVVLCNTCAVSASQAPPLGQLTPSSERKTASPNVTQRTRKSSTPNVDEKPAAGLPELRRERHTLVDDPNPPQPGTKYRCSACGTRYAIRGAQRSCQVAWMLHIDSMANAIRWNADRDNDIKPLDAALKRVYKWPSITRKVLIEQYRGWYAFMHDDVVAEPVSGQPEPETKPVHEEPVDETFSAVDEEDERAARSVPCLLPICTAPAGESCRTASGTPRPAHAERIKSGRHVDDVLARSGQAELDGDAVRRFLERCTEFGSSAYQMQRELHERFNVSPNEASKLVIQAKVAWRRRHPDKSMYSGNKQLPPDDFLRGGVEHAVVAAV